MNPENSESIILRLLQRRLCFIQNGHNDTMGLVINDKSKKLVHKLGFFRPYQKYRHFIRNLEASKNY